MIIHSVANIAFHLQYWTKFVNYISGSPLKINSDIWNDSANRNHLSGTVNVKIAEKSESTSNAQQYYAKRLSFKKWDNIGRLSVTQKEKTQLHKERQKWPKHGVVSEYALDN